MINDVQVFSNGKIDLPVKEVGGQVYFEAKAAAIGLGISQIKNGKVYVRWENVSKYLSQHVGKGDWITEPQFYKLAFKASNEVAEKFQDWVASEVLPAIRKHGMYATAKTIDQMLADPDSMIKVLTELKKEREGRLIAEQRVNELTPKASYYDLVLKNKSLVTITQIAKDYGMSGREMNSKLHDLKVQYKQGSTWLLYSEYQKTGWTQSETVMVLRKDGTQKAVLQTKWTQKGRLGLYELLKENGVLPLIERDDIDQKARLIKIWNYGKKTEYNGHTFDSLKELDFYKRFCEQYDNDSDSKFIVKVHPSYDIVDKFELDPGLKIRGARYTPDMVVEDRHGNLKHVYDVKNGFTSYGVDAAAKLRFKLFTKRYGIPVEAVVVRKNDFKVKVYGMTKKTKEHVFEDINYNWREAL